MDLPFALSPGAALFVGAAMLIAAFVRGYSGFGFSALVVTASGLVTDPRHFIPVVLFADLLMTLQQWRAIRRHVDWRRTLGLAAGAVAGVPLGLWALAPLGADAARGLIAGFVLLMCLMLLWGLKFRRRPGDAGHFGAGVASGFANAAAIGGLPVAVFFAAQSVAAVTFRATLIAYFTLLDLWTLPLMHLSGMITRDTALATALSLPLLVLGIALGGRQFLRANPADFRRFTILLLAGLSALALGKSLF